jgi:HEAT repeat protein
MPLFERLNRLLNVSSKEWPRILVAWSMIFFTRIGFIIGGSILIAVFLGRIGIDLLPSFFLLNALFMMLGTFVFRRLIHKFPREVLITFNVLFTAGTLLLSILFLTQEHLSLFLISILIAQSVLLSQLNILVSLFNEDLFSPLESQRTFPLIESAETLGGIVGGLTLSLFATDIPTYKFIVLWVLLLLAILPIVLKFNTSTMDVPLLETEEKHQTNLKDNLKKLKKIPFLKTLMLVVVLHWAMMNVIEFQYTKGVEQEVSHEEEQTLVEETEHSVELAAEGVSKEMYQEEITQRLGTLHLIFNSAALFMQLIFASRILQLLGITSSMLLHPLVTFLNMVFMTLRFNFYTASLSRGSYELTSILFKTAHDSSYYAIPHSIRSEAKEWIQGIMKPLGAIFGTVTMIILALILKGPEQTLALNIFLLVMSAVMTGLLWGLGRHYTQMSEQNLSHKLDLPTRLNAIEILAQKGHEKNTSTLQKLLKRETEPEILKESILHTLGLQEDPEAIASILEMLSSKHEHLRWAAIDALAHYHKLRQHLMDQSFTRYRVIESLKDRLKKENNEAILEKIVYLFHSLAPETLTEFLIETIEKEEKQKASFIRMLRLFHDTNLRFYLEKNLASPDPEVKSAAIIALWQFESLHSELQHHLTQMLKSNKEKILCAGIDACGFVKEKSFRAALHALLKQDTPKVQKKALLALGQMEEESTIPALVEALSNPAHEWFNKSVDLLTSFPKRFREILQNALRIRIAEDISTLLSGQKGKTLQEFSHETLQVLGQLYSKLSAHHEVHEIQKVLATKDKASL